MYYQFVLDIPVGQLEFISNSSLYVPMDIFVLSVCHPLG